MFQVLASVLFFIVFIQLFIALSIYLWVVIYRFYKKRGTAKADENTPARR